jgi:hypothetical protein
MTPVLEARPCPILSRHPGPDPGPTRSQSSGKAAPFPQKQPHPEVRSVSEASKDGRQTQSKKPILRDEPPVLLRMRREAGRALPHFPTSSPPHEVEMCGDPLVPLAFGRGQCICGWAVPQVHPLADAAMWIGSRTAIECGRALRPLVSPVQHKRRRELSLRRSGSFPVPIGTGRQAPAAPAAYAGGYVEVARAKTPARIPFPNESSKPSPHQGRL